LATGTVVVKTRVALTPLLLLVVAAAFVFVACTGSRRGIYPGEIAPDVSGIDLTGQPLSLHQVSGKVVLVNFWATWCAPCMAELPSLERLYQSLRSQGFTVVGVAVDDTLDNVKEAVQSNGITYPVLLDEKGKSKRPLNEKYSRLLRLNKQNKPKPPKPKPKQKPRPNWLPPTPKKPDFKKRPASRKNENKRP
jgi:thiol-disulfide isomerase/thioredoxin